MHDVMGDSAMMVVRGPRGNFGNTVVMDDVLTEGTSASSAAVGRAQGQYIVASSKGGFELMVTMNVVLTSGTYAGSSVTVMGRDDTGVAVRELAVLSAAQGSSGWRKATCCGKPSAPTCWSSTSTSTHEPLPTAHSADSACMRQ
uniref:Dirigent protein n=1 Tax=Aegilops tauschii subsp. strangulata TaxID=200361 RepID=A0A453KJK8_AEGTS